MNFYKTLEIPDGSSLDEIKRAYRRLALKYHPDRNNGDVHKFLQVQHAYETLLRYQTGNSHESVDWWAVIKKRYPWIGEMYPNGWYEIVIDLHNPSRLCEKVLKRINPSTVTEKDLSLTINISSHQLGKTVTLEYEALRHKITGSYITLIPTINRVSFYIDPTLNYEMEQITIHSYGHEYIDETGILQKGDLYIELDVTVETARDQEQNLRDV